MSTERYSVDTSALIDGLERYYPEDVLPGLWERVDSLIGEGRLFVSEEVWEEAQVKDEAVKSWCARRKDALVLPTDAEIAVRVQELLTNFPRMVMAMKNRNRADPFVVVVAQLRNAIVVTGEGSDGNPSRPKIPYVCQQLGVRCIRFLDLIRIEGWQFQ